MLSVQILKVLWQWQFVIFRKVLVIQCELNDFMLFDLFIVVPSLQFSLNIFNILSSAVLWIIFPIFNLMIDALNLL